MSQTLSDELFGWWKGLWQQFLWRKPLIIMDKPARGRQLGRKWCVRLTSTAPHQLGQSGMRNGLKLGISHQLFCASASTCLYVGQIWWRCIRGQPKCSGSQKPLPNMVLRLPKETNVVHWGGGKFLWEIRDHWGRKREQLCLQQLVLTSQVFGSSFHPLDHQKWCVWIPLTALWWKLPEGAFCNIYGSSIDLTSSMKRAQAVQHLECHLEKIWWSNHFRETEKEEITQKVLPNPHSGENCCTSSAPFHLGG